MTIESVVFAALRGALVLGVALAAMPLLRRASASTRRLVLVSAFAIVVLLPLATAVLPSLHLRGVPAAVAPSETVVAAVPESIVEATAAMATPTVATTRSTIATIAPEASWAPSPIAIVLAVWALGAMFVLARLGVGLVRAHRIASNARLIEIRRIDAGASHDAGRSRDRSRTVEIRSTAALDTPAVTGLFRPVILLPRDADTWTDERRELVIAHELAHVARRDCLASALAQIAVAMHWFDPLAWLANRRLRIERELAADDHVLDGGATASSYAEHLLELATAHVQAHRAHDSRGAHDDIARDGIAQHARTTVPLGALAMAEPAQVSVRIRALLAPSHSRAPMSRLRTAMFATCGIAMATFVACASPDREPPAIPDAGARRAPVATAPANATATAASTIDPAIQAIVDEEADKLELDWGPCKAVLLVLDPTSGQVLAAAHRGGTATTARLAAEEPIVPGSTVKPLVIAAALEEGAITETEQFDASPMPVSMEVPTIVDASPNGMLDAKGILAVSSNVGMVKVFRKLGGAKTATWLARVGFASAPKTIEDNARGAAFAIGASMRSTPLEIAGAYAMLANGGTYHAPTFVPRKDQAPRVLSQKTASTVIAMLESVTSDDGTGKAARIDGVRVAGKTGTMHLGQDKDSKDYYASFVGTAPIEKPRYVIFVGAETPRDGGTGGKVAAPVFARIMTRLLVR